MDLDLLCEIASEERHLGHYDEALGCYQLALDIMKEKKCDDPAFAARTLNDMGIVYHDQGLYEEALTCYNRSFCLFKTIFGNDLHTFAIVSLTNIANSLLGTGSYDHALRALQRALAIKEKVDGGVRDLTFANIHNSVGTAYKAKQSYDEALRSYNIALSIDESLSPMVLTNTAWVYVLKESYDEALRSYQRALAILGTADEASSVHPLHGYILECVGDIYALKTSHASALVYYQLAVGFFSKIQSHSRLATLESKIANLP